jgi:hypothetical protein
VAEIESTVPVLMELEDVKAFARVLRVVLDALDEALAFKQEYESEADDA